MQKWILTVIAILSLVGCESLYETGGLKGSFVEKKNVNSSVESIIKALDRSTLGVRGKSANGREIVSRYQSAKGDSNEPATTKKSRAYARLLILGDRRPYTLQMQFVIEEDQGDGEYVVMSTDDERAQKILKKLLDTLASRPDSKDFIDDFRSF